MATIYFTNNADSGDGSLREAWTNAEDGDVIMPDPTAFASSDTIEVLLASAWSGRGLALTLDGGDKRVVLNGQGAQRFMTGNNAAIAHTYRNVDFKNFYRSDYGPAYYSGLGSLTFLNCRFYGNSGTAQSHFVYTTASVAATLTFTNCLAYGNGDGSGRVIRASNSTVALNGCTMDAAAPVAGTLTSVDSLLSSDIDFTQAGFVDATNNDYRLTPSSAYLTGGTLAGTDFLGHARSGSKGAYDGSWFVAEAAEAAEYPTGDVVCDYAELTNGAILYFIAPTEGQLFVVKREAYFGGNNLLALDTAAQGNAYVALPYQGYDETAVEFEDVLLARYDCGVTSVDAQVVDRTITPFVTSSALGYAFEIQYDGDDYWQWLNPTNASANPAPIAMEALLSSANGEYLTQKDKSFRIRVWDGAFHPSEWKPRTYYLANPQATSASFASRYDWSVFASRSESCNVAPSIAGCTFVCIE